MYSKVDPYIFTCSAVALGVAAAFFRYVVLPIVRNICDRYNAWLYRRIQELEPWQRRAYLQGKPRQGFDVLPPHPHTAADQPRDADNRPDD